jgi:hypothetical protein
MLATTTFTTKEVALPAGAVPAPGYLVELVRKITGGAELVDSKRVDSEAAAATFVINDAGTYMSIVSRTAVGGTVIYSVMSDPFEISAPMVTVPATVTVVLTPTEPLRG